MPQISDVNLQNHQDKTDHFPNKVETLHQSQLNAMGVVLYEPVAQIVVANQSWLVDLCALLNITVNDCMFDAVEPKFDTTTHTLYLPKYSYGNEAELKRRIWLNVRQFVN